MRPRRPDPRSAAGASPAGRAPSVPRDRGPAPRYRWSLGEIGAKPRRIRVEPGVARGLSHLGEEGVERTAVGGHGAKDVEALDVARPLPDRVEGRLSKKARHPGLLDVSVAAEALEAFRHMGRLALADPVLEDRVGDSLERLGPLVAGDRVVIGAGQSKGGDRGGLRLDAEVGEHVLHQRLLDQRPAEGRAVVGVVDRLDDPARIPAALPSAQSSLVWLTISMIVRIPAPSSPTSRAQAPSNSTSLDAFARFPSLSLSRTRRKLLRSPSGVQRGNRKHERPGRPGRGSRRRRTSESRRTTCGP